VVRAWDPQEGELVSVGRWFQGRELDLSRPRDALRLVDEVAPTVVLHLAGGPGQDLEQLYARNVLTGVHLLEAVAAVAPRTEVVLVGSAAEYGAGRGVPLTEDAPLQPLTEYGRAKVAQTRLGQSIARRAGLRLTLLRPFNVVGAELPASSALGNIRRQLLDGTGPTRTVVCGRTDVRRDFLAVEDVARLLVALVLAPPGGVLNICSGRDSSVEDVLRALARRLGVQARVEADPALVALPAGDTVVGDASRLAALGHVLDGSPEHVAAAVLGPTLVT
jgi:nucleoside-diphosphate-sugar epimerase